jgi:hypothetical protein
MARRTSNHHAVLGLIYGEKAAADQEIAKMRRDIEYQQEQLAEAIEERRQMPSDERLEDMTHQDLVDYIQTSGICELPSELEDEGPATCPGCDGDGVLSDDPQVLRCTKCGGVFTANPAEPITQAQAMKFVALHLPLQANAVDADQVFYFDLDLVADVERGQTRLHGWADKATKRVVQWG